MDKLLADLCEDAWGVIANVSGGTWENQSAEWQEAAARWRDKWLASLPRATSSEVDAPHGYGIEGLKE